jgi:restriction system protein
VNYIRHKAIFRITQLEEAVGRKRGFFAEMQHQAKLAEQRQRAANRQREAAARKAEQAKRAAARAEAAAQRAAEADKKRMEREAAAARVAAMQAQVDSMNVRLDEYYKELDTLLDATLQVDDYVDLEKLRTVVKHPPFKHEALRNPVPRPDPIPTPQPPTQVEPVKPTGIFGRKKKLARAQADADSENAQRYAQWQAYVNSLPKLRADQEAQYNAAENERQKKLAAELAQYEHECAERELEVRQQNASLDELIAGLGYGTVSAVQEYVGIVLANSVYPDDFPVTHDSTFDPETAELKLDVGILAPESIPTTKAFRYVKSSDSVSETQLSQKALKDRYLGIVCSVALRSLHEVFEADRRGLIQSISLKLGTNATDPATGHETFIPFVAVASSRETFESLELSGVIPSAALSHLGAVVSKNPYGLVSVDGSGVRRAQ